MNEHLTLLQRGVIQRLRSAGQSDIADRAFSAWQRGMKFRVYGIQTLDLPDGLCEDFWRANGHATAE